MAAVPQSFLLKQGARSKILGSNADLAIAAPLSAGDDDPAAHTDAARMGWWFNRTVSSESIITAVLGNDITKHFSNGIEVAPTTAVTPGTFTGALRVRGGGMFIKDVVIGDGTAATAAAVKMLLQGNNALGIAGIQAASDILSIGVGASPANIAMLASAGADEFLRLQTGELVFNNGAANIDFLGRKAGSGTWLGYDAGLDLLTVNAQSALSNGLRLTGITTVIGAGGAPDATAAADSTVYYLDGGAATCTLALEAAPTAGQLYFIKSIDSTNTVTVDGNGILIDGAATATLVTNEAFTLHYDGAAWRIV